MNLSIFIGSNYGRLRSLLVVWVLVFDVDEWHLAWREALLHDLSILLLVTFPS